MGNRNTQNIHNVPNTITTKLITAPYKELQRMNRVTAAVATTSHLSTKLSQFFFRKCHPNLIDSFLPIKGLTLAREIYGPPWKLNINLLTSSKTIYKMYIYISLTFMDLLRIFFCLPWSDLEKKCEINFMKSCKLIFYRLKKIFVN
jgi:hypothetical protein